jgi:hypothetical protein
MHPSASSQQTSLFAKCSVGLSGAEELLCFLDGLECKLGLGGEQFPPQAKGGSSGRSALFLKVRHRIRHGTRQKTKRTLLLQAPIKSGDGAFLFRSGFFVAQDLSKVRCHPFHAPKIRPIVLGFMKARNSFHIF